MKTSICIQNGNDNNPDGATGTSGEVELVHKVFGALAPRLTSKGIELYYDDYNCLNTKRLGENLSYFISIHFDGSTNPNYDGGLVDCSPTSLTVNDDWKLAQTVADKYFIPMGIRFAQEHRNANTSQYYAFNFTGEKTKQFIIELGTLTNQADRAKCQDFNKIARLLAEGIFAYLTQFDANYQANESSSPSQPPQTTTNSLQEQLQASEKLVKTLQTDKIALATQLKECQKQSDSILGRLNAIKDYVSKA
jgi:hypothetical protein